MRASCHKSFYSAVIRLTSAMCPTRVEIVERYIGVVKLRRRITKEDVDRLEDELWLCAEVSRRRDP